MKLDQEMEVLSKCYDLLKGLDDEVKIRTMQWLSSKFRIGQSTLVLSSGDMGMHEGNGSAATPVEKPAEAPASASAPAPSGIDAFNSFTDLYKHVKPSSDAEKALAAAVFLQLRKDSPDLTSAQVQKELKRIDQRVSNITQAISALVKKKFMIQLAKEGTSQQARKKYKVTREGIKFIDDILKK